MWVGNHNRAPCVSMKWSESFGWARTLFSQYYIPFFVFLHGNTEQPVLELCVPVYCLRYHSLGLLLLVFISFSFFRHVVVVVVVKSRCWWNERNYFYLISLLIFICCERKLDEFYMVPHWPGSNRTKLHKYTYNMSMSPDATPNDVIFFGRTFNNNNSKTIRTRTTKCQMNFWTNNRVSELYV